MDVDNQRWYCYKDDQTFLAKEQIWRGGPASSTTQPQTLGTRNRGIMRGAGVDLLLAGISQIFWIDNARTTLNEVQSVISQYGSPTYTTQVHVPLYVAAQGMAIGVGSMVLALICVLLVVTRKNPYSKGWWLGFGVLNGIGGAAWLFQAQQLAAVGTVNMRVGDIIIMLQNSQIEYYVYALVLGTVGAVLMVLGAKKQVAAITRGVNPIQCKVCKKKMTLVNPDKQIWYCENDRRAYYGLENRTQENVAESGLS